MPSAVLDATAPAPALPRAGGAVVQRLCGAVAGGMKRCMGTTAGLDDTSVGLMCCYAARTAGCASGMPPDPDITPHGVGKSGTVCVFRRSGGSKGHDPRCAGGVYRAQGVRCGGGRMLSRTVFVSGAVLLASSDARAALPLA